MNDRTVYLDNSATTRPFDTVIEAVSDSMSDRFHNPSALYREAVTVEKEIDACRNAIAGQLGCSADGVIFTSGGTEANNLAILGVVGRLREDQSIAVSSVEHPSVRAVFDSLKGRFGITVIPADKHGIISVASVESALKPNTGLVSVMQANNEVGALQPIHEIAAAVKRKCGAYFHVDGVQGFMRQSVSMNVGVDLYTLSGHKIHAPKGIGALVTTGVRLHPLQIGGGQENGLRSGTENVPGIVGLYTAVRAFIGHPEWAQNMRNLKLRLLETIHSALPSMMVNGPDPGNSDLTAPHIINFSFPGLRGEVLLHALEAEGVLVGTGAACSSRKIGHSQTLEAMGLPDSRMESAIRISLSPMTTEKDIDVAADKIIYCVNRYSGFKRR